MKENLLIFVYLSVIVNAGVVKNNIYRLDIVHYNDFHNSFEEASVKYPQCKTNDSNCLGGFARLFHAINWLMKIKPNALLLNAGDVFQGTYWYTLLKWNVTQKFINMLPNDAHALGNHEFDDGIADLAPYLATLRAPMLVANMDASKEPLLSGLYVPSIVVEKNGRRIGIIGVTTPSIKLTNKAGKIIFLDPIPVIKKEAALLAAQGVNIIIVLSHCGLSTDKQIAKNIGDYIDVIVGGHSHSLLWNGNSPTKEKVDGPYPIIVNSETKPGHKVLIVTASAFTKYLGNLTVYFNDHGEIVSYDGEPVFLNRSIPEDQEVKALLQVHVDELHNIVNQVVGAASDNLFTDTCNYQECGIGNFVADSFLNATKEMVPSDIPYIAFLLKNNVRGSLEKGNITRGDLINTLPFTYKVVTFAIKGRYLVEALEQGISLYWKRNPFQGPWIPQVAGMQVTFNTTTLKAASVFVKNNEIFEPIDPDKEYQVTTLDFLFKGGNGFTMFSHGQNSQTVGIDREILENYIKKVSPFKGTLDQRLLLVP